MAEKEKGPFLPRHMKKAAAIRILSVPLGWKPTDGDAKVLLVYALCAFSVCKSSACQCYVLGGKNGD